MTSHKDSNWNKKELNDRRKLPHFRDSWLAAIQKRAILVRQVNTALHQAHVVVAANHPVDRTVHSPGETRAKATASTAARAATVRCPSRGTAPWCRPGTRCRASCAAATRCWSCRRPPTPASGAQAGARWRRAARRPSGPGRGTPAKRYAPKQLPPYGTSSDATTKRRSAAIFI